MTADVFGEAPSDGVDPLDPAHVVRLVTYLAGPPEADGVTGQVFVVYGPPKVTLMAAPTIDEVFTADGDAWDSEDLAKTLTGYFADRDPGRTFSASALVN